MPRTKVAIVVDTFPRWSERFIARECSALLRSGVDFSIFCLRAGPEITSTGGEREWDGLIERRIVLPRCLVPSLRSELHLPQQVRDRRDRIREILGPLAYAKVRCAESLTDLLRENRYTHVHAHFANLPSTIGWMAAMESGLPLSISVHARDLFVEAQMLAEKAADARAIFCCNPMAEVFLKKTVPNANIIHMPHGLPLEIFAPKPPAPATFHFLAAGRFVEKKGFLDFIEALARPEILAHPWTATILGEGPLKPKIVSALKRLKLNTRVEMKDPALGEALRNEFARASVFVAPYKESADGDSDGVPNAVLEALALGVPVIARGAAVLNEKILFAAQGEKTDESLAREFERVLKNPALLRERTDAAREWVAARYNSDKNIQPLIDLLERSNS